MTGGCLAEKALQSERLVRSAGRCDHEAEENIPQEDVRLEGRNDMTTARDGIEATTNAFLESLRGGDAAGAQR